MLSIRRRLRPPLHARCRPGEVSLVLQVTYITGGRLGVVMISRASLCREKPECSPKFIVTLDGVPSPLASLTEHDMDTDHAPNTTTFDPSVEHKTKPVHLSMTSDFSFGGKVTRAHTRTKYKTGLAYHVTVKTHTILCVCGGWGCVLGGGGLPALFFFPPILLTLSLR